MVLTGSQGAGIGVGGMLLIFAIAFGTWFWIHRSKARKAKEETKKGITPSTTATTADTSARENALELGTSEGNTHQLETLENAHELDSPQEMHEMGRSNTRKSRRSTDKKRALDEGPAELEGDVAWKDGKGETEQVKGEGVGKGFVLTD